MKIKFLKALEEDNTVKCTIQKNGRLGFSSEAVKLLNINTNIYAKIGIDEEEKKIGNLYLEITDKSDDETLRFRRAGEYFFLNTTTIFSQLEIDYIRKKIIFNIVPMSFENRRIYKLNRRELDRKA